MLLALFFALYPPLLGVSAERERVSLFFGADKSEGIILEETARGGYMLSRELYGHVVLMQPVTRSVFKKRTRWFEGFTARIEDSEKKGQIRCDKGFTATIQLKGSAEHERNLCLTGMSASDQHEFLEWRSELNRIFQPE
jgi:hypothetical protein